MTLDGAQRRYTERVVRDPLESWAQPMRIFQ
jgi:hypothetical protein